MVVISHQNHGPSGLRHRIQDRMHLRGFPSASFDVAFFEIPMRAKPILLAIKASRCPLP
jgi:hypothetical protein